MIWVQFLTFRSSFFRTKCASKLIYFKVLNAYMMTALGHIGYFYAIFNYSVMIFILMKYTEGR